MSNHGVGIPTISLFAGVGLLDLGIRRLGFRTVCFVEREAYAQAVLVARMEDASLDPAPIWDDVTSFDGHPWRGVVDCVAGGFPCQDLSLAGKGAGLVEGSRSGLWRHFARIIGEVRPTFVLLENVPALVNRGLRVVLSDLAAMGFDAEWGCVKASDVGAPHKRDRIFLLAYTDRTRLEGWVRAQSDELQAAFRGRDPVAHAHGGEVRQFEQQEPWRLSDGVRNQGQAELGEDGVALAHAPRVRRGKRFRRIAQAAGRALAGDGGELVVHAHSQPEFEPHDQASAFGAGGPWADLGRGREPVADPHGHGCEGERFGEVHEGQWEALGDNPDGCVPFPPTREDFEAWTLYLERYPSLEPAVRRSADGGPSRLDRLRVLGNGVVPDQAELAFCVLADRAMGRYQDDRSRRRRKRGRG